MSEMKRQDEAYLAYQHQVEMQRTKTLADQLHFLREEPQGASETPRHIVFVEDEEAAAQFDAAEYFETPASLLGRSFNRPTRTMLNEGTLVANPGAASERNLRKMDRARAAAYNELSERSKRERALKTAMEKVRLQRQLMHKGSKVKRKSKDGRVVYRWAQERKR